MQTCHQHQTLRAELLRLSEYSSLVVAKDMICISVLIEVYTLQPCVLIIKHLICISTEGEQPAVPQLEAHASGFPG